MVNPSEMAERMTYLDATAPEKSALSCSLRRGLSAYIPMNVATNEQRLHTKNSNDSTDSSSAGVPPSAAHFDSHWRRPLAADIGWPKM